MTHHDDGLARGAGFVFAFKLYDPKDDSPYHAVERAVRALTSDEIIHVAVMPVVAGAGLAVCSTAFTAMVGTGFLEHPADVCLDSGFLLLYVEMDHEDAAHGVRFLHTLRGKPYNYAALPLTILPHWLKGHTSACSRGHPAVNLQPSHVFCSQMGLLLCHACNMFAKRQDLIAQHEAQHMHGLCGGHDLELLNPACCTPGELFILLQDVFRARACDPATVRVCGDVTSDMLVQQHGAGEPGACEWGGWVGCDDTAAATC